MKVLVCGGRKYDDQEYVSQVLDMIHSDYPITCVVHGAATGADTFGESWAKASGIAFKPYPADWDTFKHAAGSIRNAEMLKDNPDIELVIVFPGNNGTNNMRNKAEKAGINVYCA